jgi:hypothetical protein
MTEILGMLKSDAEDATLLSASIGYYICNESGWLVAGRRTDVADVIIRWMSIVYIIRFE